MKEGLDILIEEKWSKRDGFAYFISAIEKLTIPNGKNITLHQGDYFIDLYKNLFM